MSALQPEAARLHADPSLLVLSCFVVLPDVGIAPSMPQGVASSSTEPDQKGYPETLTMGHLETTVRILAMLARGAGAGDGGGSGCRSTFDERLDFLVQAYYFLGRIAAMVVETIECGRRYRLYEENVAEGTERNRTPFQEWWNAHGEAAGKKPRICICSHSWPLGFIVSDR